MDRQIAGSNSVRATREARYTPFQDFAVTLALTPSPPK